MRLDRTLCLSMLMTLLSLPAHAADVDDAKACAKVEDATTRLACYDAVFRPAPAPIRDMAPSEVVSATPPAAAEPAPDPRSVEQFGAVDLAEPEKSTVREIEATIVSVRKLRSRARVLELDNGQVWREKRLKKSLRLEEGDTVRIKAGSLGLHKLFSGGRTSTDVERVE